MRLPWLVFRKYLAPHSGIKFVVVEERCKVVHFCRNFFFHDEGEIGEKECQEQCMRT